MSDKNNHTIIYGQNEEWMVNTIIVGRSSSRCGNCRRNAFPDEGSHKTVKHDMKEIFVENKETGEEKILPAEPGIEGCGTEWFYIVSDFVYGEPGYIEGVVADRWPQYEWKGYTSG